jgi:hypothetical protein
MLNNELITFNITDSKISELNNSYSGIFVNYGDIAGEKSLREAIRVIRDFRVMVEERRKELKAGALEWGRKVDNEAKRITAALLAIEDPLRINKENIENERERIKQEKIRNEQERINNIHKKINVIANMKFIDRKTNSSAIKIILQDLKSLILSAEEYQEFIESAIKAKEETINFLESTLPEVIEDEEKKVIFLEEQKQLAIAREKLKREQEELAEKIKKEQIEQQMTSSLIKEDEEINIPDLSLLPNNFIETQSQSNIHPSPAHYCDTIEDLSEWNVGNLIKLRIFINLLIIKKETENE